MNQSQPLFALVFSSLLIFSSCKDKKNEDITNSINKNGSVETAVTVEHLDSLHDVLVTKHAVWVKGAQFKTLEYRDTVPALGTEMKKVENTGGQSKNMEVKKEYEIFITVK
jgi:hypothetical protein